MNLIDCKLIPVPYSPRIMEAGIVLKCKTTEFNSFHIITEEDIKKEANPMLGSFEPVKLFLAINQPMEEYYFRDYYIEMALPPNRPVVRRVTEEVINLWLLSGEKIMQKYFKVIAKPEVIGAIFNKIITGDDGKLLNEYSLVTAKHLEDIMNNNGDCSVQVKYPIRDSDNYILSFVNNKVIMHLNKKNEKAS
ncbi:MAG: hypothetical protein AABY22_29950 [Nanoarchaeota archaeon]